MRPATWIKPLVFFFLAGWAGSFLYASSWAGYDYSPNDALKNYTYHEAQLQKKLTKEIELQKEMAVSDDRVAETQRTLAASYAQLNDWAKAEEVFKDMVPKSDMETVSERRRTSLALNELAGFYRDWGKFDRALPYYQRVLALDSDAPPLVARDFNNLAVLYLMWGESETDASRRQSRFVRSAYLFDKAFEVNNERQANSSAQIDANANISRDLNATIRANWESLVSAAGQDVLSLDAFVSNQPGD